MPVNRVVEQVKQSLQTGNLLPSTAENLIQWLTAGFLPDWAVRSIEELVNGKQWEELNDRFFRSLEFGTGGMRGRTIGKVVTREEMGENQTAGTVPQYAGVGSNLLNDFNVIRATIGLYRYTAAYLSEQQRAEPAALVIAHDVRHFSRHFCLLAASVWMRLGGVAYVYPGPRSTPQLSFSVRALRAHAGIVITASHNPPHDNGYKVYFGDGAQVVPPHDKKIIQEVDNTGWDDVLQQLQAESVSPIVLSDDMDKAYLNAVEDALLQPEVLLSSPLKVVYTPIHGTGGVASFPLLRRYGITVLEVEEQSIMDGAFPSVKSPNPENAEALSRGLQVAEAQQADVVLATDPDCDRMGVAVRDESGKWVLLSGNQIGSLLAHYTLTQWKKRGWLTTDNAEHCCLIKTFVTTPLQEEIGKSFGVKVLDTLTGFKWIGHKLARYEDQLRQAVSAQNELEIDYDRMSREQRRHWLQKHATAYIFGGEESYGYLASDKVRDKDGNAAVLLFVEMMASLQKEGKSVFSYLGELYREYGYFEEGLVNQYYEGASGAQKIQNILKSYRNNPPVQIGDFHVERIIDFGRQKIVDADGDVIPSQDFFVVELSDGFRYAVRGSGTEPKIKFYLFGRSQQGKSGDIDQLKQQIHNRLVTLHQAVDQDARIRAEQSAGNV
jgi:phosphoglucomutase